MSIPNVTVSVSIYDIVGTGLPNAQVLLDLTRADRYLGTPGGLVPAGRTVIQCDATGLGSGPVFPNQLGTQGTQYAVTVIDQYGNVVFPQGGRTATAWIPNQACKLHECLFLAPSLSQADSDGATLKARDWAQKLDGPVETDSDGVSNPLYSARYYSNLANTSGSAWSLLASQWAQYVGADVPGQAAGSRSSRSWSQDNLIGATYGGSSRDWAMGAGLIDGVTYKSARSYALDSATSAGASATSAAASDASRQAADADRVQTGLDRTQTDADVVNANGAAATSLSASLTAVAQAGLASTMALSAASVAQQDLSGVVAAALHRGPAAVTATCFMDTSKDSLPVWPDQTAHLSYANEVLNGAWIPHPNMAGIQSELVARALGGTLVSTNLMAAASAVAGWAVTGGTLAVAPTSGRLRLSNSTGAGQMRWTVALTSGKTYVIRADLLIGGSTTSPPSLRISNDGGGSWTALAFTTAASGVFLASVTGNHLVEFGNQNSNASSAFYIDVGNIVLQEVTAFAPSGSFYPNATDGKFYRLWKNLFQNSEQFDNATWAKTGVTVTANAVTEPLNGTLTADKLVSTGGAGQQRVDAGVIPANGTISVYAKAGEANWLWAGSAQFGNEQAWFDLTNGIVGTKGSSVASSSITSLGGGWYRCQATMAVGATQGLGSIGVSGADNSVVGPVAGNGLYVWGAQLEYGTSATTYEQKVADGSQTETFRGSKAKPPRLGLSVVDGNRTIVYDLLETGRPMWMVFAATGVLGNSVLNSISAVSANLSYCAYKEGVLSVGGSNAASMPLMAIDFARDDLRLFYTQSLEFLKRRISQRQDSTGHGTRAGVGYTVTSTGVQCVAMTTMNDAPVDPVTGLKVPTYAVGTVVGVTIVQNDGSSVTPTSNAGSVTGVAINPYVCFAERSGTSVTYALTQPGKAVTASPFVIVGNGAAPDFSVGSITGKSALMGRSMLASARSNPNVLELLRYNEMTPGASLAARLTDLYNTAWMEGDIRRCLLSDVSVGVLPSGVELVSNGTFDTDTTGWTAANGLATISWSAGAMTVTRSAAGYTSAVTPIATVIGQTYVVSGNITAASGGLASAGSLVGLAVSNTPTPAFASAYAGDFSTPGAVRPVEFVFTAQAATSYIETHIDNNVGGSVTFDNISCRPGVFDRSYKAKGLAVFGNGLVRSQVGVGSQLTAISGWSATSYLRDPVHSADLDPGTGPLRLDDWVSVPVNPQLAQNLIPKSKLFGATGVWSQDGLVVTDNYLTSGGVAYSRLQQPAVSTGSNRIYLAAYTVTPLLMNVNTSLWVQRIAASTDKLNIQPVAGWGAQTNQTGVYDPVTQTVSGTLAASVVVSVIDANTVRLSFVSNKSANGTSGYLQVQVQNAGGTLFGADTGGVAVGQAQMTVGSALLAYEDVPGTVTVRCHPSKEYSFSAGAYYTLGIGGDGFPMVEVYDTASRLTASVSATAGNNVGVNYGTGQFIHLCGEYATSGTLTLKVNAQQVAQTTHAPLLTLTNASAVLTVGQNYALTAPFPGSIALSKIGMTLASADAAKWMYEQEKEMFRDGAQVTLLDSTQLNGVSYDEQEGSLTVTSATSRSKFNGMVRVSSETPAAGAFSGVAHAGGMKALTRITTNPGVDITMPPQNLKEELLRYGDARARADRPSVPLDWVGGFTCAETNGSAILTSAAPSVPQGSTVLGANFTGNVGITGTQSFTELSVGGLGMTAAATATSALTVSLLDFILPTGMEVADDVLAAGVLKQEGSTKDYTRLYDGFRERVRFAVAPGSAAWVRVNARRMSA